MKPIFIADKDDDALYQQMKFAVDDNLVRRVETQINDVLRGDDDVVAFVLRETQIHVMVDIGDVGTCDLRDLTVYAEDSR